MGALEIVFNRKGIAQFENAINGLEDTAHFVEYVVHTHINLI